MYSEDTFDATVELRRVESCPAPIRNTHDVFSNRYRRQILQTLDGRDGPMSLRTLAERLAAWERETGASTNPTRPVGERSVTWLRNMHVQELSEFGLVAYDSETDTVRLREDVSLSIPTEDPAGAATPALDEPC